MQQFSKKSYWLSLALFFCGCLSAQAQSNVDSIQHNGKHYYVYPFRKEVKIHSDYWKIIDDDAFFEDYNNYFNCFSGDFENDAINGKMISRDEDTYTEATFKDGYLDGYLRTYLTFPDRDSMLLYDINLQNGMLNGESKSYHTNGKLAKRGFFLDAEPTEDYEAYDTLGFKFHYVKFQYGMPVEEKIWEENALSIRYQFNWEDSIEFYPDDITSTMSLEALLAKEGFTTYTPQDKYYDLNMNRMLKLEESKNN